MLIRKDTSVTKMQAMKAIHDTMSEGIQIASLSGTMSFMNDSDRARAPLENVMRYLSKFSLPDFESSQTFFRYSSCSFSALFGSVTVVSSIQSERRAPALTFSLAVQRVSVAAMRVSQVALASSHMASSPHPKEPYGQVLFPQFCFSSIHRSSYSPLRLVCCFFGL